MGDAAALLDGVSHETLDDLKSFEALFREQAGSMNLVAESTIGDLWGRHILDSLQLRVLKPDAKRWLDLGSGGGFPGIIVAILLKGKAGGHVDLVESTGKKARFLQQVVDRLHLPAAVWNQRIENLPGTLPQPEIVSARALARLPLLLSLASPWLRQSATGLFHKGRNYREEVQESRTQWRFDMVEHRSMTDSESAILEISGLRAV